MENPEARGIVREGHHERPGGTPLLPESRRPSEKSLEPWSDSLYRDVCPPGFPPYVECLWPALSAAPRFARAPLFLSFSFCGHSRSLRFGLRSLSGAAKKTD